MENNQQTWNEIRNSGIAPAYKKQEIKDEIASKSLQRADKRYANNTKTTSAFTFGWQLAGTDGQAYYSQSFNATAESSGAATTDYVNFGAYVNIKHISMMCYEPSGEVINISRNSFVQMGTIKADIFTGLGKPSEVTLVNNTITGTASGNITLPGEGGTTTTNLQQGLCKSWAHTTQASSYVR